MRTFKLKRNSTYRNVFYPNTTYYYKIDKLNIHNDILYSHKVYMTIIGDIKKLYLMAFTKDNFNRCFTDLIKDRKEKIQKLSKY